MNRQRKDLNVIFQNIHDMENYITSAGSTGGILKVLRNLPDNSPVIENLKTLTSFLDEYSPDISTRVFYINHKIDEPIVCTHCGKLLNSSRLVHVYGKGTKPFCNIECNHAYLKLQKQIKRDNERLRFNTTDELVSYIHNLECTSSFRQMIVKNDYVDIIQQINEATSFLDNVKDEQNVIDLSYRIYYIHHSINKPAVCSACGNLLPLNIIRSNGKYCSHQCYTSMPKSDEILQKVSDSLKKTWSQTSDEDKAARYKKVAENNMSKYGVKSTLSLSSVLDKRRETWMEKYGTDNPNKVQQQRDKIRQTNIARYGVASPSMLTQPYQRWKNFTKFTMPDGRVLNIQGWEKHALELYLLPTYKTEDIVCDRHLFHQYGFIYSYTKDNSRHYYYPDFYIKSTKTFIEVKSDYTLYNDLYRNYKKLESVIKKGYNIEICIIKQQNRNTFTYEILTYEDIKIQAKNLSPR